MKTKLNLSTLALVAFLPFTFQATAGLLSETHSFSGAPLPLTPPDGTAVTVSDTRTVTSYIGALQDVNIKISISNPTAGGAYNGDYYVSLQHESGFSVLLNRVGRRTPANPSSPTLGETAGYADNGFNITLDDSAANGDVHIYRATLSGGNNSTPVDINFVQPLTGTWAPDGRTTSPYSVVTSDPRTATLSVFNTLPASGTWTLQIADLNGGGTAILDHWELTLTGTAVPEPAATAGLAALALAGFALGRRWVARRS